MSRLPKTKICVKIQIEKMNPMFAQQQMLEQQLLHAAEVMEEQIDSEMKKMDELDEDDIEKIRQRRLKAMQKAHQAKQVSSP